MASWLDPNDVASGEKLLTQAELEQRQRIAQLLAKHNASGEVMTHPLQAFAKGIEGAVEGYQQRQLKDAQDARATHDAQSWASLADAYNGGGDATPPATATAAPDAAPTTPAFVSTGGAMTSAAPIGGFDQAVDRTLGFEGGYTSNDAGKGPTNFGLNSTANPDLDVKNLTRDQAKAAYKTRYWDAIGGDELAKQNPALAHVAFDAAVNSGPARAQQWLEQSGGDPQKFQALRGNFLQGLIQSNPEKYGQYQKAWGSRMSALNADLASAGRPQAAMTLPAAAAGAPPSATAYAPAPTDPPSPIRAALNRAAGQVASIDPTVVPAGNPAATPALPPGGYMAKDSRGNPVAVDASGRAIQTPTAPAAAPMPTFAQTGAPSLATPSAPPMAAASPGMQKVVQAVAANRSAGAPPSPQVAQVVDALSARTGSLGPAAQSGLTPMQARQVAAARGVMADKYASTDAKKAAFGILQSVGKPVPYGFATLPDGTVVRQDPRSGSVTPAYQAAPKPVVVNNRLVDPTTGRAIADFSDPKAQFVDIGPDPVTGEQMKGFVNPQTGQVVPYRAQAPADAPPSTIPPAPAGVDPKIWRKEHSEDATANSLPRKSSDVASMRQEVQGLPSYKNLAQAAPVYRGMMDAAGRDTKAADLNLVYGLGKIMDPGSVVREGEIQMANDTQGMADKLNGFIKGIQGEGRLRPEARQQILQEAFGRLSAYKQAFDQDATFYRGIATRGRVDPADVLPDFGTFEPWTPPAKGNGASPAAPAPGAPARISTDADYNGLKSGDTYIGPDGQLRRKR